MRRLTNLKRAFFITICAAILVSSTSPDETAPQEPAGRDVLCLGTFIFFIEKHANQCRPGEDAAYQARIAEYARRFDDYIIRNAGGDRDWLEEFKDDENLNVVDHEYICEAQDIVVLYDHFKDISSDPEQSKKLDQNINELLARDGPPTFGDCV